ncbi:MAG: glycosyltransferase family 1 protein [Gammaproteobacteria bacterium]|nr:MAG: glycosyltransferase family 1 protein [Gammaproteobacteria bacterium]
MPRVTHVVRQYLPSIGGMEEVVRNIALHQLKTGQKGTRVITLNRLFRTAKQDTAPALLPSREIIDGIEVVRLPYYGSSRYPICPSILSELGDADVIHVHGVDFFYDFLAATQWLHKRPLVLSTHGGFFHTAFASTAKTVFFKTITKLSSKAYAKVIATSANDGQLFSKIMSEPQLKVIENGVDVTKFANQASQTLQPTLIYFGRWSVNKGLLEALDMFAGLHRLNDSWRFIIAGREYDHTLNELQSKAVDLGLAQAVELVANPSDETLRQLIQQSSYFLCLSRHEGFGIAPIEAMSAGLTPILSDIPPFRTLVEKSGLGVIVADRDNAHPATQALIALHDQGSEVFEQRRAAAIEFAQQYAWQQVADDYLEVYAQLGDKRPQGETV